MAFFKCDSLEEVILPDGLKYIGDSAFLKCRQLQYIRIPESVHTIEKWAFHGCKRGSAMEEYAKQYGMEMEYL